MLADRATGASRVEHDNSRSKNFLKSQNPNDVLFRRTVVFIQMYYNAATLAEKRRYKKKKTRFPSKTRVDDYAAAQQFKFGRSKYEMEPIMSEGSTRRRIRCARDGIAGGYGTERAGHVCSRDGTRTEPDRFRLLLCRHRGVSSSSQ